MAEFSERKWRTLVCTRNNAAPAPILSICGPSGAGKTTTIRILSKFYPVFLETTRGNPHFKSLLERKKDFNADASQKWFLSRVGRHIVHANSNLPLVLDQDPAAIVFAYSKMFLEERRMTSPEYSTQRSYLLKIEEKLQAWKSPRIVLFLDAPPDVLHHRVLRLRGKDRTPKIEWFECVRNHFVKLFTSFPNAIAVSSVQFSPAEIVARAKALIERRIKNN